jgi:hypothetical protein
MSAHMEATRAAYRLWRDDSRIGTVAAIILVVLFVGWPLYRIWKQIDGGER